MTDETDFDADDARDAVQTIYSEAGEAEESLHNGPDHQQITSALDRIARASEEISKQADSLHEAVGTVSGGAYSDGIGDLSEGVNEAIDSLQVIADRARVVEKALEGIEESDDGVSTTTVTLGAKQYEVRFEQTGYVGDKTFSELLEDLRTEYDSVTVAELDRETPVSESRLKAILDGDDPKGDEAKSILQHLVDLRVLSDEARQRWVDALYQ